MSRIICALSGIPFKCEYLPKSSILHNREVKHPIFSLPYNQLSTLTIEWQERKLSEVESYLLYLALLNSTDLIEFRTPAIFNEKTNSIVNTNMAALVSIIDIIQQYTPERAASKFALPRIVICEDTHTLRDSKNWIAIWDDCYKQYQNCYKTSSRIEKLLHKESALETYIKDKSKDVSQYARQLAGWAVLAGGFKEIDCMVADGSNNDRPILLSEYWERIIVTCCKKSNVYEIHDADLDELIEYCEDNIDIASSGLAGHTLLTVLRSTQKTKHDYFNLGDIDIGDKGTVYKILDADASIEDANKVVLIASAPTYAPKESEYPTKLHYLRARTKWEMSQRYAASDKLREQLEQDIITTLTPSVVSAVSANTIVINTDTNTDTNSPILTTEENI